MIDLRALTWTDLAEGFCQAEDRLKAARAAGDASAVVDAMRAVVRTEAEMDRRIALYGSAGAARAADREAKK